MLCCPRGGVVARCSKRPLACKSLQHVSLASIPPILRVDPRRQSACLASGRSDETEGSASLAGDQASEPGSKPGSQTLQEPTRRSFTAVASVVAGCFILGLAVHRARSTYSELHPQLSNINSLTAAQVLRQSTINPDVLEVAHYRLLQAFNFPTYGKLLAILAVGLPLVMIGAFFYRKTSGADWGSSLWKAYSIAADIPGSEINEDTPKANFVLNMVHLLSLCTFAVLVGVFTSEIEGGVEALRSGNFPLPESGHTVVLGWSSRQCVVLLKEILEAHTQRGHTALQLPIVILGEADKQDMDQVLTNEFGDLVNRLIVTRHGCSTRPLDLARVSASRAGTVIWMPPEEQEEGRVNIDVSLSATLASLHSLRRQGSPPQRVVVCEDAEGKLEGWDEAPSGQLISKNLLERGSKITSLADLTNLNGIMAQASLQPGLSSVFEEICQHSFGGYEFYSLTNPSKKDITFRQARKGFSDAVLVGVVDANSGVTHLSPCDLFMIGPEDHLLLMAEGANKLGYSEWHAEQADAAARAAAEEAEREQLQVADAASFQARKDGAPTTPEQRQEQLHKPEQVVVLSYGGSLKRLADSLAEFCAPGSKVTLAISEGASFDEGYKELKDAYGGLKTRGVSFRVMRGNLSSNAFLRKAGVPDADSVILGAMCPATEALPADADALVVASTLQLNSFLEDEAGRYLAAHASSKGSVKNAGSSKVLQGNRPLSVVCCVAEERTKDVLNHIVAPRATWQGSSSNSTLPTSTGASRGLSLQLIMTQELMSGMLTQVASDPLLLGLFEELMKDEGSELYMRAPEVYGVPLKVTKTWDEVQDAVRSNNTVCIGYLDHKGTVRLGVQSGAKVTLQPNEKLVVIAES